MFNINEIITYIIAMLPSVMNIITTVCIALTYLKQFKLLKDGNQKDISDLKAQMIVILKENYELKKLTKELLIKLDHVERL